MKKALVFLADGFEEAEAICPIDVMRRSGIKVVTAGINGKSVTSSHNVSVVADCTVDEVSDEEFDCIFCPGGMPGAVNIAQSWKANEIIINAVNRGAIVSAICASPAVVLGQLGLLDGKRATCFPGCEGYAPQVAFSSEGVVVDKNIVTGKAAGFAFDLGLKLVELMLGKEKSKEIQKAIYYK